MALEKLADKTQTECTSQSLRWNDVVVPYRGAVRFRLSFRQLLCNLLFGIVFVQLVIILEFLGQLVDQSLQLSERHVSIVTNANATNYRVGCNCIKRVSFGVASLHLCE